MPTLLHRLSQWAKEAPEAPAHSYLAKGQWKSWSAREVCDRIFHLALFLESRGMEAGDTLAIFAYNSSEWVQMDLAPHLLGALSAGIYPNSTSKDVQFILNHTEAKILGVQNAEYFKKITNGSEKLPERIETILVFDGDTSISPLAISFEAAIAEGRKLAAGKTLAQYLDRMDKDRGSFLIYTSGTTGTPKGAMISHDNLAFVSDVAISNWVIPSHGRMFSFLPLCHVAEKIHGIGVGITLRANMYFCSRFENISRELPEVQPTLLLCVPRLWEKMMEGVCTKLNEAPKAKRRLAEWAMGVGSRLMQAKLEGKPYGLSDLAQWQLAQRLVIRSVRKKMGLKDSVRCASGAAALPAFVTRWFWGLGIEILENFGQTESTGVICMTIPGKDCAGSVGRPVPGIEFKLDADGEIMTRGRHVFRGYFKNDEATRQTLDDGWLRTGDLAEFDAQGLLRIKGRKKEIMKTSGGKMVAPAPIEERLKSCDSINQVCLVGEGRKYLSALITLPEDTLMRLKEKVGAIEGDLVKDPRVVGEVGKEIDQINRELASYEKIKQFRVLARDFTVEGGELTPTMKMKRNVVESKYASIIGEMYTSPVAAEAGA